MEYFDSHTHVISPDTEKYPTAPLGGKQSDWSKERHVTGDELVAAMDDAGVQRAVVVHSSTVYGYDNRYATDSVDAHPDRLVGVGSVDFRGEKPIEELDYWMVQRGLVACRLFTTGTTIPEQEKWLDDASTYPAWGFCEEHEIPVIVNLWPSAFPQIENLLRQFPRLRFIFDHAARPNLEGGPPYVKANDVFKMSEHENIFLKVSSWSFLQAVGFPGEGASLMRALADHFGADRLSWGSNYPSSKGKLSELVQYAHENAVELSDKEKEWFFGGTTARMFAK